jgi:O-antigen/teichoic acid export membrane protein
LSKNITNIASLVLTFGIRAISDLLIIIMIGRYSNLENLGIYSFALNTSFMARLFLDVGFGLYLVREISKNLNMTHKYISNTISIIVLVSPILVTSVFFLLKLSPVTDLIKHATLVSLVGVVFMAVSSIFQSSFIAFQKMKYQSIVVLLQELVFIIGVTSSLLFKLDFIIIFYMYFLSRVISMLVSYTIYRMKINSDKPNINITMICKILAQVKPFIFNLLFTTIQARSSIIIIIFLIGSEAAGLFEVSISLTVKGIIISQIVSKALFPQLSKLFNLSRHSEKEYIISLLINIIYYVGFAICVFLFFFANELVMLVFGKTVYLESVILIKIMSIALFFKLAAIPIADILTASNNQKKRAKSVFIGAMTNVVLLFILVPQMNLEGAAISICISELAIFISVMIFSTSAIRNKVGKVIINNIMIISLPIALLLLFYNSNSLLKFVLFLSSYLLILVVTKTITYEKYYNIISFLKLDNSTTLS